MSARPAVFTPVTTAVHFNVISCNSEVMPVCIVLSGSLSGGVQWGSYCSYQGEQARVLDTWGSKFPDAADSADSWNATGWQIADTFGINEGCCFARSTNLWGHVHLLCYKWYKLVGCREAAVLQTVETCEVMERVWAKMTPRLLANDERVMLEADCVFGLQHYQFSLDVIELGARDGYQGYMTSTSAVSSCVC